MGDTHGFAACTVSIDVYMVQLCINVVFSPHAGNRCTRSVLRRISSCCIILVSFKMLQ